VVGVVGEAVFLVEFGALGEFDEDGAELVVTEGAGFGKHIEALEVGFLPGEDEPGFFL